MRPFFYVLLLLTASSVLGQTLKVESKIMPGGEAGGSVRAFEVTHGPRQFLFVPPVDWRPQTESSSGTITFYAPRGGGLLALSFLSDPPSDILASTEQLRRTTAPDLSSGVVVEEFPAFSGDRQGKGMDISFAVQGRAMRCRAAVVPVEGGYVSFVLRCGEDEWRSALYVFDRAITSFQHLTEQTRQQLAKESVRPLPTTTSFKIAAAAGRPTQVINIPTQPAAVSESPLQSTAEPERGGSKYLRFGVVAALALGIGISIRVRRKGEEEIRTLSGNYLADGREAARFEMPDFFSRPADSSQVTAPSFAMGDGFYDEKSDEDLLAKPELKEFFALAPERVNKMHELLSNFGKAFDDAERRQVLTKLLEQICELKGQASCWDLRPAWQMTSALELLLQMLLEKRKEATPSTLRSVANALDVLGDLCVPGVRPDLIIAPPISVLAVDDDPLCLRGVVFALQKAEMAPDVAADGETAVARAAQKYYDVVFMDIQMPGIDGLEACAQIRKTEKNENTPVVFVTVRSDFQTRAESTLKGGSDLMAKPFLMFEITVKALTYAMRKRLQLQQSAQRQTVGAGFLPAVTGTTSSSPVTTILPAAPAVTPVPAEPMPAMPGKADTQLAEDLDDTLDGELFTIAPAYLSTTRSILEEASFESDKVKRQEKLGRIYLRIHSLANKAATEKLEFVARVGSSLEALLKRFHQNPRTVTTSTLNTVANALRVLEHLCVPGVNQKLAHYPPVRLLVVEDDPVAKRAIVGTLQLTFEKPDSANDGAEALAAAEEKAYDVIFSDIEMPVMGGFGFCSRLRQGAGPNCETPVVFITSHIEAESRAQAAQCGGTDFIAKPFLPIEITVKALTFALEGRLRKINADSVSVPPSDTPAAPREANSPKEILAESTG